MDTEKLCDSTDMTEKKIRTKENSFYLLLSGIALISFSVLMFEITLTRIFSVMFSYHYVFIVISLALFGMGPKFGLLFWEELCLLVFLVCLPLSSLLFTSQLWFF